MLIALDTMDACTGLPRGANTILHRAHIVWPVTGIIVDANLFQLASDALLAFHQRRRVGDMRKRAKVDLNQVEIVAAIRKVGGKVLHLHQIGGGCADILVKYHGVLLLMEIKSKGGRMTPDEQAFYNEWQECMVVVYSAEEALEALARL